MSLNTHNNNYSLEEHLADSIRRAKEKIVSSALHYKEPNELTNNRFRALSQVQPQTNEDQSAVVLAMRSLQEKIIAL
jgi:hypothetical protein